MQQESFTETVNKGGVFIVSHFYEVKSGKLITTKDQAIRQGTEAR